MEFPEVIESKTKQELIDQVRSCHLALRDFYSSIPDEYFLSDPLPDGWTIQRNIKHISSSNKFVAKWISAPSFLFKLLGKLKADPIPLKSIHATNRPGLTDYGQYPIGKKISPSAKNEIIERFILSGEIVCKAIEKRTEEEMHEFRGIVRGTNLNGLVYFILKHAMHHTNVVKLRLSNSPK